MDIQKQINKLNLQVTNLQKEIQGYREIKPRNLLNRMKRIESELKRVNDLCLENVKGIDKK